MGVYVFNARTLVELLTDDFSRNTSHDFGRDIVPRVVQRSRVSVYNFTESGVRLGAYWRDIGTADAYYHANMELLVNPLFDLYAEALWPMYGLEELVPRKKPVGNRRAACTVQDTIMSPKVALGRGSDVAHSVLSAGVKIARSATVRNAILLRSVRVGEGARIQRAILDDNVEIGDGVEIGYNPEKDREYGYLTEEGVVVIPAGARVAPSQLVTPTATWRTHLVTKKRVRSRT
jgi:glucose-1-phosphate adenylyltransferase